MRRGNYFGWLVLLLFVFVTLLAPTVAEGITYEPTYGTDDNGNTWTVVATVESTGQCGPNKQGDYIACSKFEWEITPPPETGGNVIRAVVNVPAGGGLVIYEPSEKAVKIADCDTSTKQLCDPYIAELDALIFNSLKGTANPWDHEFIAVYLAPSSIRDTTILLVTDWGYVYASTKGPAPCGDATQSQSSVLYAPPTGFDFLPEGASGYISVQYAICDENAVGTPIDPATNEPYNSFSTLYNCWGSADSFVRNSCEEVNIAGPDYGLVAYSNNVIFAHGDQFWYGPEVVPPENWYLRDPFEGCTTTPPDSFTCYSGDVCAWSDSSGEICDVTQEVGPITSVSQYSFSNSIVFPDDWGWLCIDRISSSTCHVNYWSDFAMINRFTSGYYGYWPWGTR